MKNPFKFNGNIKRIILYGLFIFYAVIIVWYYFSRIREGLDTNNDNIAEDTLKGLSGNIDLNTQSPPIITTGNSVISSNYAINPVTNVTSEDKKPNMNA